MNKEFKLSKKQKIYLPVKRAFGFFGSFVGILICFSLLWWWIFIINLFATHFKPIFCQERVGKKGKMLKILKFRTMKNNVDPNLTSAETIAINGYTKFGKFLRKTSLDETLQLFIHEQDGIGGKPFEEFSRGPVVLIELHNGVEVDSAQRTNTFDGCHRDIERPSAAFVVGERFQRKTLPFDCFGLEIIQRWVILFSMNLGIVTYAINLPI